MRAFAKNFNPESKTRLGDLVSPWFSIWPGTARRGSGSGVGSQ